MLHRHDTVTSTMELAHRLAERGAPTGDAVVARRQLGGRGQQGRAWSAEDGGLWLSVIGRPDASAGLEPLSLRIGLACAEVLETLMPDLAPIGLKWPNDLIVRQRKLGGVLSEARWQGERCLWVVTGVGINLANPLPPELRERAIAAGEVCEPPSAAELAPPVAAAVAGAMVGGPLTSDELEGWRGRDVLAGVRVSSPIAGVVEGIDASGALLVRAPSGDLARAAAGVVGLPE